MAGKIKIVHIYNEFNMMHLKKCAFVHNALVAKYSELKSDSFCEYQYEHDGFTEDVVFVMPIDEHDFITKSVSYQMIHTILSNIKASGFKKGFKKKDMVFMNELYKRLKDEGYIRPEVIEFLQQQILC